MITVVLRGGLGNQMFQYAIGLSLARKHNIALLLDTTFLNDRFPRREFTYRTYDLDVFTLNPRLTALSKISASLPVPGLWLFFDSILMAIKSLGGVKIVREKNEFEFDPGVLEAGKNTMLWGRWQSEKYFESARDQVREDFTFRHSITGDAARLKEIIERENSVAVSVRRGDYVKFKSVLGVMGDTNLEYYKKAFSYIASRIDNPHFFIFSDDLKWCKENLKLPHRITYVEDDLAGPKFSFHLQLMSLCKHNIVANSTFSWWGAWLNGNPKKIVIAPSRWYADGKGDGDIVPASWIKV